MMAAMSKVDVPDLEQDADPAIKDHNNSNYLRIHIELLDHHLRFLLLFYLKSSTSKQLCYILVFNIRIVKSQHSPKAFIGEGF